MSNKLVNQVLVISLSLVCTCLIIQLILVPLIILSKSPYVNMVPTEIAFILFIIMLTFLIYFSIKIFLIIRKKIDKFLDKQ